MSQFHRICSLHFGNPSTLSFFRRLRLQPLTPPIPVSSSFRTYSGDFVSFRVKLMYVFWVFEDGWGAFHLGFSGNTDPEPGRCRRTDGKKWRCSRDAVPDQKYCERHINRGRHRSRKPVEGQNGQANVSVPAKVGPVVSSSSSVPVSGSRTSTATVTAAANHHNPPTNR